METNDLGCLLFYSLVCSICIFPVPSPLPSIYFELMYIFYFHVLLSNGLLKADFFFPPFFCSLHWQQQGQTTFTILQNGPQNRYHSCVLFVQSRKYTSACTIFFFHRRILWWCYLFYQGSLNKFHGQHALRERARKLDQGILIIRYWNDGAYVYLLVSLLWILIIVNGIAIVLVHVLDVYGPTGIYLEECISKSSGLVSPHRLCIWGMSLWELYLLSMLWYEFSTGFFNITYFLNIKCFLYMK